VINSRILKKMGERNRVGIEVRAGFNWLRIGSIGGKYFACLSDYQLLKGSATWSYLICIATHRPTTELNEDEMGGHIARIGT
jgi:hypothetical protein